MHPYPGKRVAPILVRRSNERLVRIVMVSKLDVGARERGFRLRFDNLAAKDCRLGGELMRTKKVYNEERKESKLCHQ